MPQGRPLFRQEAIEFQQWQRHWGDVALPQPISTKLLAWSITLVVTVAVVFLAFAQFPRKQTVSGYLAPAAGVLKIFPKRTGTVTGVYVTQGQEVKQGQALLTIATPQLTENGEDVNATKLDALNHEKDLLEEQIEIQAKRVKLAESLVEAANYLLVRGDMSELEAKRREDALLEHQQTLQSLRRQVAEKTRLIADINGNTAYTIRAPGDGRVSILQTSLGQTVEPRDLQLEIVPDGTPLQAELLIPTRAAGFARVGQEVRLLYDPFPYQNFGAYPGRLVKVSHTVLTGADAGGPVELKEPAYKAIAELDRPDVDAYGKKVPLQAGMLLKADIILDKRSLANWLLDPLLSKRMQG